jgi:hypothetical protein
MASSPFSGNPRKYTGTDGAARAIRPRARSVSQIATTTGAARARPDAISFADAATTTRAA